MYSTREEVESWLEKMKITIYVINEDLTVDVNKSVDISYKGLKEIPIQFGIVNGDFYCYGNNLINLKGCPEVIHGDFNCSYNKLTSLKGCPEVINGNFSFSYNKITNLENFPKKIKSGFNCDNNDITSLENCPKVINGDFNCYENELISLEGCPEVISGAFNCSYNKLNNLEGCPEVVNGYFNCSHNNLTSLKGCPKEIKGTFSCKYNKINDLSHLNVNKMKNIYLSNNEIVECNWIDETEEKGLFSKISLLFRDVKKIDLSNNNINEKSLLSVKSIGIKIVIKLKNNKDSYLSEEYDSEYLPLFKLKNNLSTYQDKKMVLIKNELNMLKNEINNKNEEIVVKKRKL